MVDLAMLIIDFCDGVKGKNFFYLINILEDIITQFESRFEGENGEVNDGRRTERTFRIQPFRCPACFRSRRFLLGFTERFAVK